MSGTCPPITSAIAAPLPLYGMCVRLTPAAFLKTSPARCADEPLPAEAYARPGCAFAHSITSGTVFALLPDPVSMTIGTSVAWPTAMRSSSAL